MAIQVDGYWVCGVPSKDGSPCNRVVSIVGATSTEEVVCAQHAGLAKVAGRSRGYDALLPEYIAKHYDDSDDTLLSLRPKVALLDSFLRKKLTQFESGGMLDVNDMGKVVQAMKLLPCNEELRLLIEKLDAHLERARTEMNLERDIRNLIQEIAQTTKQEVGQLVSMGQVIPLEKIIQLVRELHVIATSYCATEEASSRLTQEFHSVFVRNTKMG
jgi:hypothetical protein